ncbi:MAG: M56 family metallopeptidase [Bacteroidota bacterium]
MQFVDLLFPPQLAQSLGWTLLHSLWQGALLALGLRMFLRLLKGRSPQAAYIASLCTLVLMLAASTVTLYIEYHNFAAVEAVQTTPILVWTQTDQIAPALLEPKGFAWEQAIPYLSVVWLTGLVFFAIRWLGGLWYLRRLRLSYTFAVDYGWQHKLNQIARKMGITRSVTLLESGRVQVPMVLGHLKPVILLPLGLLSGISPKQLESILAHELSHIRRYDFLINQILAFVEMVFFYHPAYWWVSNQIEENREHCCDDMAVAVCEDAITYARMLTELESRRQNMPMMALGMAGNKNGLYRRVERIVQPQARSPKERASIIPALLLTACLIGLVWTKPQAQTPEILPIPKTEAPTADLPVTVATFETAAPAALPRTTASPNAQPAPPYEVELISVPQRESQPLATNLPRVNDRVFNLARQINPNLDIGEPIIATPREMDAVIFELDQAVTLLDGAVLRLDGGHDNLIMLLDSPPVAPRPPIPPRPRAAVVPPMPPVPVVPNIDWEDEDQRSAFETQMREFEKAQELWAKEYAKVWEKEEQDWAKEMEVFQLEMALWQKEFERTYAEEIARGEESPEMREDILILSKKKKAFERIHAQQAREQAELARMQAQLHAELARRQAVESAELARVQALQQAEVVRQQAQLKAELARVEAQVLAKQSQKQLELARREAEMVRRQLARENRGYEANYIRYQNRLIRELERDGLIDSGDSRVKVDITEDYVKVNGRRLNRSLARKYRKMAEDYNVEEGRIIFREK